MVAVTNNSRGPRVLQVKGEGKDAPPVSFTLQPGETRDLDILDQDDRVFKGLVDSREISLGGPKELSAEEKAEHDEARFRNDPAANQDRELAARAAATPGLADPLPADPKKQAAKPGK
jgi:hypothetical protein